jgi:tetratricopeptide (TPR) repeat protein
MHSTNAESADPQLREGQLAEVVNALSRAAKADPTNVDILVRLGMTYRAGDRLDAARYVLERAVRIAAGRHALARLTLASVLELDRRPDLALMHYILGLHEARAASRSVAADTREPELASLIEHAGRYAARERRAWFERSLQRPDHGAGRRSGRIDQALAMYLDARAPVMADPRQRPGILYVPNIETMCFLDHARFAWLDRAAALLAPCSDEMDACIKAAGTSQVSVFQRGVLQYEARCHAPRLQRALAELPLARVPHDAPDVEIVELRANSRVPLHYGHANSRCRLILNCPDSAALQVIVGGEKRVLDPGQSLILDASFGVEYVNSDGRSARALAADVWHPGLSEAEQQSLCVLIATAIDFDMRLQELNS